MKNNSLSQRPGKRPYASPFFYFAFICATFLIANRIDAQSFQVRLTCGGSDSLFLQPMLLGDTLFDTVRFINNANNRSDSIFGIQNGTSHLLFLDSSITVDSGASVSSVIRVIPDSGFNDVTVNLIGVGGGTCNISLDIITHGITSSKDGATFSLQHTASEAIAIRTDSSGVHRTFFFRNDSSGTLSIDTISILQAPSFSIDSLPPFPLLIPAHDSFPLSLRFNRSVPGTENGYLITKPTHTPISDEFKISLQGMLVVQSSVNSFKGPDGIVIVSPNPLQGWTVVRTQNMTETHVIITDILGRNITESNFQDQWRWDASSTSPGTYFVIVTGKNTAGVPIRSVQRIMLE